MKKLFNWDKKYLNWGITAFCVFAGAVLFYMALRVLPDVTSFGGRVIKILSPFVWGLIITYLLNPLTKRLTESFRKVKLGRKNGLSKNAARGLAVTVSEIVLIAIITALVYLIIPQLYQSIETIVTNSSLYIGKISLWLEKMLENFPEIEGFVSDFLATINTDLTGWLKNTILPRLGSFVTNITAGVYYFLTAVYNLLIGIVVSVYLLSNMEYFKGHIRRLAYCVFEKDTVEKIRTAVSFTDRTFMGFINGKLLDSAIIGLICYIVCAVLRMPYTLLVSVIVGVTNVVPFFGPFIGAIPSAFIILLIDPVKCLIFIVFIIILQQIDGNIIGPKILGSSIGINGFWVMFSIILGAGLFGFWGMLLGVPVFVVVYEGLGVLVRRKLQKRGLPTCASDYTESDSEEKD